MPLPTVNLPRCAPSEITWPKSLMKIEPPSLSDLRCGPCGSPNVAAIKVGYESDEYPEKVSTKAWCEACWLRTMLPRPRLFGLPR